jgi:S1-C subfamily serine protease
VIDAPEKNQLGLKGGDVILSVDGRPARGPSSLLRILQSYDDGDVMKLEIMRNKSRQTISSKVDREDEE